MFAHNVIFIPMTSWPWFAYSPQSKTFDFLSMLHPCCDDVTSGTFPSVERKAGSHICCGYWRRQIIFLIQPAIGAVMAYHTTNDRLLGEELRRVEHQYLNARLTADEKRKPALVQDIMVNILEKLRGTFSDVAYTGSNYEFTAVPGKSDYDIQLYLKIPRVQVERCGDPAWMKVRGGPTELQDASGYLSTTKARTMVQSKIDRALQEAGNFTYAGYRVYITRSMHGPATTLNVKWQSIQLDIDVVVSLKAGDLDYRYDLVGKPNSSCNLWRVSYSTQEVEKLRNFHYNDVRKVTLLRIVKVIKKYKPQFGYLPSYFYKNLLFLLDERNPYASWDKPADLTDRFKEMMQLMCDCLTSENLPLHFNKSVNYLQGENRSKTREIANFLQGLINRDRLIELVQAVPQN